MEPSVSFVEYIVRHIAIITENDDLRMIDVEIFRDQVLSLLEERPLDLDTIGDPKECHVSVRDRLAQISFRGCLHPAYGRFTGFGRKVHRTLRAKPNECWQRICRFQLGSSCH